MNALLTHGDFLRRSASSYGPRPALVGEDGRTITYAELDELTNRLASALLASGLRPGDAVMWLDHNSVEYHLAYFATAKAGMRFSPLNYWLRPNEMAPLIDLVRPAAIIARDELTPLAASATAGLDVGLRVVLGADTEGWTRWDDLLERGTTDPLGVEVDEDDIHELIFTSGTTGQSKGVLRSQRKRNLDSMAAALGFELNRNDHLIFFLPQFHVGGSGVPNQILIQGGQVTVLKRFDPVKVAHAVGQGATYITGVPAHYNLLFESGALEGIDTSCIRGCYVGGSAASKEVFEAILKNFPQAELVHGYGSTESGPHTMALRGQAFLDNFGSLGLPVVGTEARVVSDGRDVETGEVGELWVRSISVMDGYIGRPDLTDKAFQDGWLLTGDLVRRDENGLFYMVDRLKDLIITGGENVYPHEVEGVLASHPSVSEVAVIGVPDAIYEERVVAYVRLQPGVDLEAADLIAFVRSQLAGFKTPKELYLVPDLPRTGVGKIAKAMLRTEYSPAERVQK
jgi:acyl-CoA synthetase (AMP-forming)/AMP-acid ligase II